MDSSVFQDKLHLPVKQLYNTVFLKKMRRIYITSTCKQCATKYTVYKITQTPPKILLLILAVGHKSDLIGSIAHLFTQDNPRLD